MYITVILAVLKKESDVNLFKLQQTTSQTNAASIPGHPAA